MSKGTEMTQMGARDAEAGLHLASGRRGGEAAFAGLSRAQLLCSVVVAFNFACCIALAVSVASIRDAADARGHVVVTDRAVPPDGYTRVGALFKGSGEWVRKPPLPHGGASDMRAVAVGDTVYLLGGVDSNGSVLSAAVAFDAVFERYNTSLPPMPTPRYRFCAAAVGDYVYALGGYSSVADGDAGAPLASVDRLHLPTMAWSAAPAMPRARGDLACAAAGGRLFAFGGYGAQYSMADTGASGDAFDAAAGAWAAVAPMPTARGDALAVARADGSIAVLGGWNDQALTFLAAAERYDPAADTWSTLPALPRAKGDAAAVEFGGDLFVAGGEVWSGQRAPCAYDPVQICDVNEVPLHDTEALSEGEGHGGSGGGDEAMWVLRSPLPSPRFRIAAAVANGAVFAFGGHAEQRRAASDVMAFYDTDHPRLFAHRRKDD